MLSFELLRKIYPSASVDTLNAFVDQAPVILPEFEISSSQNRIHFFLAQIGHESGGLTIREENLNYSAARMRQVWPTRFLTAASTDGFAHNPQALANKVYGGRMGNDTQNDGWTYRGRGYIQITGKEDYKFVGQQAGLDLIADPDQATDLQFCLRVACGYWRWRKINAKCDQGDFVAVTKLINGGTVGLQDRYHWLERVQSVVAWPLANLETGLPATTELQLSIVRLKTIQLKLKALGHYAGSIDGVFGKRSREALKIFQAENGLPKNGLISQATLSALGV